MPPDAAPRHPLLRQYARFGLLCMALVHLVMGALTASAAVGLGGEKADHKDTLAFLERLPFGRPLIWLLVGGLIGYVAWRLAQAWFDPSRLGRSPRGLFFRSAYLLSAAFHGVLAWYGIRLSLRAGGSGQGGPERVTGMLLHQPMGPAWVWMLAAAFAASGLTQIVKVASGRFRRRIKDPGIQARHHALILATGTVGHLARGVVLLVVAYFFWRAGLHYRAAEAGGTEEAMGFLAAMPHGPLLLAAVAAGLAAYGIFLGIQAWSLKDDLAG